MKFNISRIVLLTLSSFIIMSFAGCGKSNSSSSESESTAATESKTESEYDKDVISNPKNEVGNGYVVIHDESSLPAWVSDFRYDCGGKVIDYWGNEVFSVTENDLLFNCGVSAHKFENGLYGYIDLNGETVIEPIYSEARPFVNGSALVTENDERYYIDLNGNKSEDRTYNGYHGDLTKHEYYGTFTGQYLIYQDTEFYQDDDGTKHFITSYGYSDASGNDTDMPNFSKLYSFINGFALVKAYEHGEIYFIDENFNRVTDFSGEIERRLVPDGHVIVNAWEEGNWMMGIEYVYGDGYFVLNTGNASDPKFEIVKIVPELYKP